MKLYVANVNFAATEIDLEELFSKYGDVTSVKLIYDKMGRSRGFGFIEVADEHGKNMIRELNGLVFMSRDLVVDYAKPK